MSRTIDGLPIIDGPDVRVTKPELTQEYASFKLGTFIRACAAYRFTKDGSTIPLRAHLEVADSCLSALKKYGIDIPEYEWGLIPAKTIARRPDFERIAGKFGCFGVIMPAGFFLGVQIERVRPGLPVSPLTEAEIETALSRWHGMIYPYKFTDAATRQVITGYIGTNKDPAHVYVDIEPMIEYPHDTLN